MRESIAQDEAAQGGSRSVAQCQEDENGRARRRFVFGSIPVSDELAIEMAEQHQPETLDSALHP